MRILATVFVLLAMMVPSLAVNPDEVLSDPAMEQRARTISAKLRCLVCQNQSIDESDAPLARDLRILVRERLTEGDTNEAAVDYIVARYGEYVLLQPRFAGHTLILWLSPFVLLILGASFLYFWLRGASNKRQIAGLSSEEESALQDILEREEK